MRHGTATGPAPADEPLTYPGPWVERPGVLSGDRFVEAADAELDELLASAGSEPMAERTPLAAVGSNANLAQLRRKFERAGVATTAALAPAALRAVRVGHATYVSRWGYVPAALVADPAADTELVVGWFTDDQLAAIDATELGPYRREVLPRRSLPVLVGSGAPVEGCAVYVATGGVLADRAGRPVDLAPQRELLAWLFAEVPSVAELSGGTAEGFVQVTRADPEARARVRDAIRAAGRFRPGA